VLGAAYLAYVGLSLIVSSRLGNLPPKNVPGPPARLGQVFLQGLLTNVLNPKVALFFLAFLPQFVAADASSKPLALMFLGVVFDVNGTLWNLIVAWSAARLSGRLSSGDASFKKWFNRIVGSLFIGIGIRLALSSDR